MPKMEARAVDREEVKAELGALAKNQAVWAKASCKAHCFFVEGD